MTAHKTLAQPETIDDATIDAVVGGVPVEGCIKYPALPIGPRLPPPPTLPGTIR